MIPMAADPLLASQCSSTQTAARPPANSRAAQQARTIRAGRTCARSQAVFRAVLVDSGDALAVMVLMLVDDEQRLPVVEWLLRSSGAVPMLLDMVVVCVCLLGARDN